MFETVCSDRNGEDDFGWSLRDLLNFAFGIKNNGRSFISDLDALEGARHVLQAFIGFGRPLNMSVTAERVVTQSQLAMQSGDQCAAVQGFLVTGPARCLAVRPTMKSSIGKEQLFGRHLECGYTYNRSMMRKTLDFHDAIKALAHPSRLEFLTWLKAPEHYFDPSSVTPEGGVSAGSFQRSGLSLSAVSSHLAVLHRAGLVRSHKSRSSVYYRRDEFNIALLKSWLDRQI